MNCIEFLLHSSVPIKSNMMTKAYVRYEPGHNTAKWLRI